MLPKVKKKNYGLKFRQRFYHSFPTVEYSAVTIVQRQWFFSNVTKV